MKAYKDLNKTQECEDGDLVAVAELGDVADFVQRQPEKRPVFIDDTAERLDRIWRID